MSCRHTTWFGVFVLLLLGAASGAEAVEIRNHTQYPIQVRFAAANFDGADGREIPAGTLTNPAVDGCFWTTTKCYAAGTNRTSSNGFVDILIKGDNGDLSDLEGDFFCRLKIERDGVISVFEQEREYLSGSGHPSNVYCVSRFIEDSPLPDLALNCGQPGAPAPGTVQCPDIDYNGDGQLTNISTRWSDPWVDGLNPTNLLQQKGQMRSKDRDVRFFVTGDPQFDNANLDIGETNHEERARDASVVLNWLAQQTETELDYRGFIVAGDITQNARSSGSLGNSPDELNAYKGSVAPGAWYGFEGLGNHDVEETGTTSSAGGMRDWVGRKARATVATTIYSESSDLYPNYSWDWHDVHFVQLHTAPGYESIDPRPACGDDDPLDTYYSMNFLQLDLANRVGNTGRPVVLIHHYGVDDFSTGSGRYATSELDGGLMADCGDDNDSGGYSNDVPQEWWAETQRIAYWNAIRNFNVVAIFTGHAHQADTNANWKFDFERPAGALSRPDGRTSIPTFNAAAARGGDSATNDGALLRVGITECNDIEITKMGVDHPNLAATSYNRKQVSFSTEGWADLDAYCVGDLELIANEAEWRWNNFDSAIGYDMVRGLLSNLRASGGNYATATSSCILNGSTGLSTPLGASLPQTGDAYWYLVRGERQDASQTWDSDGPSQWGDRDYGIEQSSGVCP